MDIRVFQYKTLRLITRPFPRPFSLSKILNSETVLALVLLLKLHLFSTYRVLPDPLDPFPYEINDRLVKLIVLEVK